MNVLEKLKQNVVRHKDQGYALYFYNNGEEYKEVIRLGIGKINYYSYMSKAGYMAAKKTIESGTTNYLHDVEYAAMQAMKEDVKKAIKVFSHEV